MNRRASLRTIPKRLCTLSALSALLLGAALAAEVPEAHAETQAGWRGYADTNHLLQVLSTHRNHEVEEMSSDSDGEWVMVYNTGSGRVIESSSGFDSTIVAWMQAYINTGRRIDAVAVHPNGKWIIVAEDYIRRSVWSDSYWSILYTKIRAYQAAGKRVEDIAFDDDGVGFVLVANGETYMRGMPNEVYLAAQDCRAAGRAVHQVSIAPDGRWVLTADNWYEGRGIPDGLTFHMENWRRSEQSFGLVNLSPDPVGFMASTAGLVTPSLSDPVDAAEYDLRHGSNLATARTLFERMEALRVAGVAIATLDNGVIRTRGYGVLEAGTERAVHTDSLFEAASISKPIAAAVAMSLVEDGSISLDDSLRELVDSNRIPSDSAFSRWVSYGDSHLSGTVPADLTLRHLLSHTSTLRPHGSRSADEDEPLPSTYQALRGYDCSWGWQWWPFGMGWNCSTSDSRAVWFDNTPFNDDDSLDPSGSTADDGVTVGLGDHWRYSGGGFLVAQSVMEALSGSDFATLARQRVLDPVNMHDSTFELPIPAEYEDRIMLQHDDDGSVSGDQRVYPWATAGGLMTTAGDLAEYLLMLEQQGTSSLNVGVLSPGSVADMSTRNSPTDCSDGRDNDGDGNVDCDDAKCATSAHCLGIPQHQTTAEPREVSRGTSYGLGLYVSGTRRPDRSSDYVDHGGAHDNIRTFMALRRDRGEGFVIMAVGGRPECPSGAIPGSRDCSSPDASTGGAGVLAGEISAAMRRAFGW